MQPAESTRFALQKYLQLQADLEQRLRQGHLCIARARYSMGADRVSPLQFPSKMKGSFFLVESTGGCTASLPASEMRSRAQADTVASTDDEGCWRRRSTGGSERRFPRGARPASKGSAESHPPGSVESGGGASAGGGEVDAVQAAMSQLGLGAGSIVQELAEKYGVSPSIELPESDRRAASPGLAGQQRLPSPAGARKSRVACSECTLGVRHVCSSHDEEGGALDEEVPINWFGKLVPRTLLDANADFNAGESEHTLGGGVGMLQGTALPVLLIWQFFLIILRVAISGLD